MTGLNALAQVLSAGVLLALGGSLVHGADSHPDLSGVWTVYRERGTGTFGDRRPELPYTPQGKAKVDAYQALVGPTSDNPGAHCLGAGMPESMTFSGVYPMEIIQRPEQITVIYEAHTEVRRFYFPGKVIAPADRLPSRDGYSIARWQGPKLIVETDTLKEQQDTQFPHSDQAHIIETYHLETDPKGARILVDDWEMTDPATYTKPIKSVKKWLFDPKGILLPYECDEEAWLDHLEELKNKTAAPAKPYQ